MKIKNISTDKMQATLPEEKMAKFYETLEGKILKHIISCLNNKNIFEAYFFLWSFIEQVLIKQLIVFIAKHQKVEIPASLWKTNQVSINNFYLAISQDKNLFSCLERGRKKRNQFTHKLIETHKDQVINKEMIKAFKSDFKTVDLIFARLTGKTPIPVLSLYAKGWNDCLKKTRENINKMME
jgi:hypothetical protein